MERDTNGEQKWKYSDRQQDDDRRRDEEESPGGVSFPDFLTHPEFLFNLRP